jgi:hypothetical protein
LPGLHSRARVDRVACLLHHHEVIVRKHAGHVVLLVGADSVFARERTSASMQYVRISPATSSANAACPGTRSS